MLAELDSMHFEHFLHSDLRQAEQQPSITKRFGRFTNEFNDSIDEFFFSRKLMKKQVKIR